MCDDHGLPDVRAGTCAHCARPATGTTEDDLPVCERHARRDAFWLRDERARVAGLKAFAAAVIRLTQAASQPTPGPSEVVAQQRRKHRRSENLTTFLTGLRKRNPQLTETQLVAQCQAHAEPCGNPSCRVELIATVWGWDGQPDTFIDKLPNRATIYRHWSKID